MERRGSRLSRRQFVVGAAGLGLLAGCGRLPGSAQPSPKVHRLGYLSNNDAASEALAVEAFRQGLRELGYVEGQNLVIEWRFAENQPEQLVELVQLGSSRSGVG
jgi:putative ABC transport system substrate-binding protein